MKRILLSIIVLTIALQSSFAGHTQSILNIRAQNNTPIVVQINGVRQGPPSQQHKLVNLPAGINNIKVISVIQNPNGYGGARTILFNGTVRVKPGFITNAVVTNRNALIIKSLVAINGYGNLNVRPSLAASHAVGLTLGGYGNICNKPGRGHGHGFGHRHHPQPAPICRGNIHVMGCGHNRPPVPQCHGDVHIDGCSCVIDPPAPLPMHPADFELLMNTIANRNFDDTKIQIAKNALANNFMTSEQIRQLLQLFSFESSRLAIAKFAFDSVLDQQNFYVVYDAFHFDSSIRELDRFIYG